MITGRVFANRTGLATALLCLAIGIFLAHVVLYIRHVNDDAFITFRYSMFLAEGIGPYFNASEHVEGYTNFLQMILMAGVYRIIGHDLLPAAAKLFGILFGGAALVLSFFIGRLIERRLAPLSGYGSWLGGLAAILVALFPGYALNSTSGLETALYAFLVTLSVYTALLGAFSGRWYGSGIFWAAAVMTRPEGIAVFAVCWLASLVSTILSSRPSRRSFTDLLRAPGFRHLMLDAAVVVLVFAGHTVFRVLAYDGEFLPNTYHAKTGGHWGHTPLEYIRHGALSPFLGIIGASAGMVGWIRIRKMAGPFLPLFSVALFGACLPLIVGCDWMPGWRFSVPYLPVLATITVTGWIVLLRPVLSSSKYLPAVILLSLCCLPAVYHHGERMDLARLVNLRADGYATGHQELARWIRDHAAEPGDTVALMDIGIVGYYCKEQRILDITGLTDRYIAKSPGSFLKKTYDPSYILDQEPEIIVLVFSAFGDITKPMPPDTKLGTWIKAEAVIYADPDFQENYMLVDDRVTKHPDWLSALAARVGAARVFEHAHPGQYYLLAAFRRGKETATVGTQPPPIR